MNKAEFRTALKSRLKGLPADDIEQSLEYYSEMIDDRLEEGLAEEEITAGFGSLDDIAAQILMDTPFSKLLKTKVKPKRTLKAWEIVLIAIGSPIWFSLFAAAFAVVIAVYAAIWSVDISLWAVEVALIASAPSCVLLGVVYICTGHGVTGAAAIFAGVFCAGLSIFMFFACRGVTKAMLRLTKKIALGIKRCFIRKEKVQ